MDRPSVQTSKNLHIKRQWEHGTKRIINKMLFLKIDNDRVIYGMDHSLIISIPILLLLL